MCRNIGECTSIEVSVWSVVLLDCRADVEVQVCLDLQLLIKRAREVITEASCRAVPSLFGANINSSTNSKNVWASSRELWCELRSLLSIVALAGATNTVVTGGFEDSDTTETHLADQVTDLHCIFVRNSLLVVAIRVGNDLGKRGIWLAEKILVVWEIWLILIIRSSFIKIGDERWRAASDELRNWEGMANADDVLYLR